MVHIGVLLCGMILVCLAVQCNGFAFGAPQAACKDMTPRQLSPGYGHSQPPLVSPHPFRFRFRRDGNRYTIVLRGPPFKGFFIQARDDFGLPIGEFYNIDRTKMRHVDCGLGTNAVTHVNNQDKTQIAVRWSDPDNYGVRKFVATVVLQKNSYWVKIEASEAAGKDLQDFEDTDWSEEA